jgi:hypothetical protein
MEVYNLAYDLLSKHELKPEKGTLQLWLSTRKNSIGLSTTSEKHPGMFSTTGYKLDSIMYSTAMTLEILGGVPIIIGAYFFGPIYFLFSILGVAIGFWVDTLIGKKLNRNNGFLKYIEGKLLINKYNTELKPSDKENNNHVMILFRDNTADHRMDIFLKICLYFIAALKTFFFTFFIIISPMIYIGIAVAYFFIAWIHIKFTGYKMAEDKFRKSLIDDYRKWLREPEKGGDFGDYIFRVPHPDTFKDHSYTPHPFIDSSFKILEKGIDKNILLEKEAHESGKSQKIYIKYRGVILDSEIEKMRDLQQDTISKDLVTIESLKTQFEKLGQPNLIGKPSWQTQR